jgi:hypothetical protein
MDNIALLRDHLGGLSDSDQAFAQSLLDQAQGRGLSAKQLAWIDKLIGRATAPQTEPLLLPRTVEFMQSAALMVNRPRVVLRAADIDIRLSIAGYKSRTPGLINITSTHGAFDERVFYGRIGQDGQFEPSLTPEPERQAAIVEVLKLLEVDPAAAAAAYGKLTGVCSFCSIPLSDIRSLAVGYGQICARKYGLPWGATSEGT